MLRDKRILVIIPARGGSKGVPGKNMKVLGGKPLILHTIDLARSLFDDDDICVTTDDEQIINLVKLTGLKVPFIRPKHLATDTVGMYEVLLHAIDYYEQHGKFYNIVLLLQPTSPFRKKEHIKDAISLYSENIDMVVSVKESTSNPYYNLFEEDENGYLHISKGDGVYVRRQDSPKVWEYNGSIYVMNVESLKSKPLSKFEKKIKYPMENIYSIDIDLPMDWELAEHYITLLPE